MWFSGVVFVRSQMAEHTFRISTFWPLDESDGIQFKIIDKSLRKPTV